MDANKIDASRLQSILECPVCMNLFTRRIRQSAESHPICKTYKDALPEPKQCPTCRYDSCFCLLEESNSTTQESKRTLVKSYTTQRLDDIQLL